MKSKNKNLNALDCAEKLINTPLVEYVDDFLASIRNTENIYDHQEDILFDFKKEFPSSMKNRDVKWFVRSVLAFHNSFGGILIIGVEDTTRYAGQNKTSINIEKLNTKLRELTGESINMTHLTYGNNDSLIDLLIVPKRLPNKPPIFLLKEIDGYLPDTIWIRRGHEVLEAQSRDIGFLFSPRTSYSEINKSPIMSWLPPNPAMIKKFVGRIQTLSQLMNWIATEDEPRKFLCGRGGTGKSSIAFEFAKIFKDYGGSINTVNGKIFERVIYLSAKEKKLHVPTREIVEEKATDFSDYRELLIAICIASNNGDKFFASEDNFYEDTLADLENRVKSVFDQESILIVIDDIDTLTTKGTGAGFDSLFMLSVRAKCDIRLLYTQRNPPQSIENSIEIKGFQIEKEYIEFIEKCCTLFEVPMPNKDFIDKELCDHTEFVPLMLETVISLRKHSGTYKKAIELFIAKPGEDARRYLFEREYDLLPSNGRARNVLAAISMYNQPVSNQDIQSVTNFGESVVVDCIGSLISFFLSTTITEEGETHYFVNPVTQRFVREKSEKSRFGEAISERVKNRKAGMLKQPKELLILNEKISKLRKQKEMSEALKLFSHDFSVDVFESPLFRMMRAMVSAEQSPPKFSDAREDFLFCKNMNFEHVLGMRAWYNLEKNFGNSIDNQIEICDCVINGKSYAERVKMEFLRKKSSSLFVKAQHSNEIDAYELFQRALIGNHQVYNYMLENGEEISSQFIHTRSSAFAVFNSGVKQRFDKLMVSFFRDLHKDFGLFHDPLYKALLDLMSYLSKQEHGNTVKIKETNRRKKQLFDDLLDKFQSKKLRFKNSDTHTKFIEKIKTY